MSETINYGFWIWSHKLDGVLLLLAKLCQYDLSEDELEGIRHELTGTNDEQDQWAEYPIIGQKHQLAMKLAYDAEEKEDMIHLRIETNAELRVQLEMLDLFQSMVKNLEIEQ